GLGSYGTATDDDNLRRFDARNTSQEHAGTASHPFQEGRADLNGHTPGHFAHRHQERQLSCRKLHRFVGDADDAFVEQPLGELAVRSEVQVREEHLALPQHLDLVGQRLLYLHHEFRARVNIRGRSDDAPAHGRVLLVRNSASQAGARLDQYLVTVAHQLLHHGGRRGHPVLALFHLFWDPYDHGLRSSSAALFKVTVWTCKEFVAPGACALVPAT